MSAAALRTSALAGPWCSGRPKAVSPRVPLLHPRAVRRPVGRLTKVRPAASREEAGAGPLNGSKPFGTKWQWEFRAKDKPDAQDTAPWLLMSIKLAHYFTLVAQGTLSYVLFAAGSYLTSGAWHVGGVQVVMTQLEVFLLVLGSVYQAAAGGFFIMAHEYDGWEIAHFAMPDNTGPNVDMDNNDRLRLVAYQLLWMFQAAGMGMAAYGLQCALARAGLGVFAGAAAAVQSSPLLMGAAATALVTSWFTFATWEPNFSVKFATSQDAARTPIAAMVVFILAATTFGFSIANVVGAVCAFFAVLCFSAGGMCEAFLAEGLMEQRWHLLAVTVISTGSLLLILGMCKVAGLPLPWVGAGGGLSACGWWYAMLAGVAVLMVANARKMPAAT